MTVRDKDNGLRALLDRVQLGKPSIDVGIFETDGSKATENGETVLDIATFHEFGTIDAPERSFLRAWFDENEDRAKEALRKLMLSVVKGQRSKDQALEVFGLWLQGEVQKRISQGISPALAPSTIAKKGSSVPLIDTGQLRASVTYRVKR